MKKILSLTKTSAILTWCFLAIISVIGVAGAVTAWISYNNF
ncbi:hypothetical protein [Mesoplasma entomophilum]|nr:hypothetical protein [Mesoplasma entomophilum]